MYQGNLLNFTTFIRLGLLLCSFHRWLEAQEVLFAQGQTSVLSWLSHEKDQNLGSCHSQPLLSEEQWQSREGQYGLLYHPCPWDLSCVTRGTPHFTHLHLFIQCLDTEHLLCVCPFVGYCISLKQKTPSLSSHLSSPPHPPASI